MHYKLKKEALGFTLIELLVVIAIIAILAVVGISVYSGATKKARDVKRETDVDSIAKTYETKYTDSYTPLSDTDFSAGQIPVPPEGGNYSGLITGNGSSFQVCAALEDNPERTCNTPSATCHCKKSSRGVYIAPTSTTTPTQTPTAVPTPTSTPVPTAVPTPTPPSYTLDQQNNYSGSPSATWHSNGSDIGQSFTAGMTGQSIKVILCTSASYPSNNAVGATSLLYSGAGNGGALLSTSTWAASTSFTCPFSGIAAETFFSASVNSGNVYTAYIRKVTDVASSGNNLTDRYTRGDLYLVNSPQSVNDFSFQTYVQNP